MPCRSIKIYKDGRLLIDNGLGVPVIMDIDDIKVFAIGARGLGK